MLDDNAASSHVKIPPSIVISFQRAVEQPIAIFSDAIVFSLGHIKNLHYFCYNVLPQTNFVLIYLRAAFVLIYLRAPFVLIYLRAAFVLENCPLSWFCKRLLVDFNSI